MKRALIVGYVWPEPNSSAAGARIVQLIQALQAGEFVVDFACAAALSEHQIDLSSLNVPAHSIALNCSSFEEFVRALGPDVVIFDRFVTEEQFGWRVASACPAALRVLDTEDLHSLRAAREQLLKQALASDKQAGPVLAESAELFCQMRRSEMILREVASILRCDMTLMISPVEIALLQDYFQVPQALLYLLPFMVNPDESERHTFIERRHFVTIGNFRHNPNWDAVLWLKQCIWPELRRQVPEAELHIYGAYPPKKATQLHNPAERFYIKGWADDALAVIGAARVLLAPLRFGAGIKGKLLDAMRCATPNVATPVASEGMGGEGPWPGAIATDAESFAREAARLYLEADHWRRAADACLPLLRENFDVQRLGPAWVHRLHVLLDDLDAHRQKNFLGAMFQFHAARSTEFMSRWIEVKSRFQGDS